MNYDSSGYISCVRYNHGPNSDKHDKHIFVGTDKTIHAVTSSMYFFKTVARFKRRVIRAPRLKRLDVITSPGKVDEMIRPRGPGPPGLGPEVLDDGVN